jgi:succinate dehydrogenase/fumarate reductase flavoprotein subunit
MEKADTRLAPIAQDDTFDVVVLGSGGAGFSAALTARLNGAKVLLVERTAHVGGTTALSAATTWVPGTKPGLKANPDDTREKAAHFLDLAVGDRSDRRMRDAFLAHGPAAIEQFEAHTALQFQVRMLHPDYMSELEDAVMRGRAIEPKPFDGKRLGPNLTLLRPPIPEFTVLGGMMVDRDDIFHLLRFTQSWASFSYGMRIVARHIWDKLFWPRSTRLVMGNAMIARLLFSYLDRGGQLVTHTEAIALERNANGVHRVVLRQTLPDGSVTERTVQVRGGVVLATGGFNRHPQRRTQWLPGVQDHWCPAAPGHTGTAQDLALQLGARMGQGGWSHAFWAPVSTRLRADGSTAAFPHFVMDRGKPGMLTVDASGRRYLNESSSYHVFGIRMQEHHAQTPSIPSWLICDAAALKRYGIGMVRPGGKGLAPYLADGYLKRGDTLDGLAQVLDLPAQTLQDTVARFNRFADTGVDEDFQRGTTDYQRANGDATWPGPNPCLGALREGPFYAVALYPGDIGAATGLVTDTHAQVLDANDQPLGGLYACGNDMHSIMGGTYPAPGITIGPGLTFGYIAARHACQRAGVAVT